MLVLKILKKVIVFVIILFFLPQIVYGAMFDVVINEIAWMGTGASAYDEWIELRNNTNQDIDLKNWRLVSSDGSPEITFSTSTIPAQGFYLIERTNDETISDILADLIYTGSLSNNGEHLQLYNQQGDLIDEVNAISGWPAGDNINKATMERINPFLSGNDQSNWATNNGSKINGLDADNQLIFGTPKSENSVFNISNQQDNNQDQDSGKNQNQNQDQNNNQNQNNQSNQNNDDQNQNNNSSNYFPENFSYQPKFGDILINEIVSNPDDGKSEWIELYNTTNKSLNLENWTIEDNTKKPIKLNSISIEPYSYYVLKRPDHFRFYLNNSGDIITLKYQDQIISQVVYGDFEDGNVSDNLPAPSKGESLGLLEGEFIIFKNPTPGEENILSQQDSQESIKQAQDQEINEENDNFEFQQSELLDDKQQIFQGQVLVLPNTFAKSYFYISGYRVEKRDADFPEFKIGDLIEIKGELKEEDGKKIIKAGSFKILGHNNLIPLNLRIVDINESYLGKLVKVFGQVIEKTGYYIYLIDEDLNELPVYFKRKTKIDRSIIKEGDKVALTGILWISKDRLTLFPRFQSDIEIISKSPSKDGSVVNSDRNVKIKDSFKKEPKVIKIKGQDSNFFASLNLSPNRIKYIIIGLVGLISLIGAIIWKIIFKI